LDGGPIFNPFPVFLSSVFQINDSLNPLPGFQDAVQPAFKITTIEFSTG
jgi:hypothetical protein